MVYLDYNATTPCDPTVIEAMLPWFYDNPGNAASKSHIYGWKAEEAVRQSRAQLAELLQVEPAEIIYTSGATEAVNLALKGVFQSYQSKGRHIVTLQTEHKAVLDTCDRLEKQGAEVTYLPVNESGILEIDLLEKAIRTDTILVAIMWANNETGVLQDMEAIGQLCAKKDVLLFSDATQAVGKIPCHPKAAGIHLAAFSGHKFYGPKGIGGLYIQRKDPRVTLTPLIDGGGHERGFRSGTLNVPGIVGLGKAAEIALDQMVSQAERNANNRDLLEKSLMKDISHTLVNGDTHHRLPHVTNLAFKFVDSEQLMVSFNKELAVASGSACTSASLEPSHVLRAMGLANHMAASSIRFSLGKWTTEADIHKAIAAVQAGVTHLRNSSPVWDLFQQGVDVDSLL